VSLNVLLGYAIDAPTPLDTSLDVDPAMPLDTVLARARSANADLLVIDRRMDEARARLALAHALRTPDLTPEGSLTRRSEPEFDVGWRAALAVSVPLFTTHAAGVRVEEATIAQLQSEREATLAHVSGEVTAASAIVDAQREQYVRYRDQIVPQALQVERMAEDSYRLGQTPIAAYLQALQSSRDVRLRSIQAMADLQNALADLERAVGAPLDPTAVADASPSASLTLRSAGTSAPATTAVSSAATVARP
jgi:cobalt-zinc-cadmium efflux system outer membrane protein